MRMHLSLAGLAPAALLLLACDGALTPPVPTLTLAPDSVVLALHESVRLTATVTAVQGRPLFGYYSSDEMVASVDQAGVVRAVGHGSAWVRAWLAVRSALTDSVLVRVPAPPGPWVVVSPDTVVLFGGGSAQLSWRVGNVVDPAGSTAVRFTSSDTTIVEARATGLLCGRGSGIAFVRVQLLATPSFPDSARVRVWPAPVDDAASISIQSVVDSAGQPVDRNAVHGTIRVTVLVDTHPATPCYHAPALAPELRFDGVLWERAPERDAGGQYAYTFVVDTRALDAAGRPRLPNGAHTMSALARLSDGVIWMVSSLSLVLAN